MKSGKFIVRVDPKLHGELAKGAKREGVSMNRFCEALLAKGVGFTPAPRGRR